MKQLMVILCAMMLVLGVAGNSTAILINGLGDPALNSAFTSPEQIDFEDQVTGIYSSIAIGDITFSALNNSHLRIDDTYQGYNQSGIYLDNGTYSNNGFFEVQIDFANPTDAFAFTWGMAEGWAPWIMTVFDSSNNLIESQQFPSTGSSGAGEYYGIAAATNISYAILSNTHPDYDWVAIDNFTYNGGGDPVPEPATMLLLGSGLIGLAGMGRKKFFSKA